MKSKSDSVEITIKVMLYRQSSSFLTDLTKELNDSDSSVSMAVEKSQIILSFSTYILEIKGKMTNYNKFIFRYITLKTNSNSDFAFR